MADMTSYDLGDLIQISAVFTNQAGTALDPTAVLFRTKNPAGVKVNLVYGVDAALVRDSEGHYHVNVDANVVGTWLYRFWSTGTGQGAETGSFIVESDPTA